MASNEPGLDERRPSAESEVNNSGYSSSSPSVFEVDGDGECKAVDDFDVSDGEAAVNDQIQELEAGRLEVYHKNGVLHLNDYRVPASKRKSVCTAYCVSLYKIIGFLQFLSGVVLFAMALIKRFVVETPSALEFACAFFVVTSGILVIASRLRGDKRLAFGAFMISLFGVMMLCCGLVLNAMVLQYARLELGSELDTVPEFGYYTSSASTDEGLSAAAISFVCCAAGCCLSLVQILVTVHVLQKPFTV